MYKNSLQTWWCGYSAIAEEWSNLLNTTTPSQKCGVKKNTPVKTKKKKSLSKYGYKYSFSNLLHSSPYKTGFAVKKQVWLKGKWLLLSNRLKCFLFSNYEFDEISLKKLSAHLNACLSEPEPQLSG